MKRLLSLVGVSFVAIVAFWAACFSGLMKAFQRKQQEHESQHRAEQFREKVIQAKAESAARKAEADAAVAKVDETARVEAARDAVDVANDLIRDADKG